MKEVLYTETDQLFKKNRNTSLHTLNHTKAILLRIPAPRTLFFSPPYFPWLDLKETEFAGSVYLLKKKVLKKK